MSAVQKTCGQCNAAAGSRCPSCDQPLCPHHAVPPHRSQCGSCHLVISARARNRLATRVAVASSAALAGMAVGAVAIMLVTSALGLPFEIIIMLMLMAEIGIGALSARTADRHVQRWLDSRGETHDLPRARLLPGPPK